eukprot:3487296-Pyramimonas_sp.AAC.1
MLSHRADWIQVAGGSETVDPPDPELLETVFSGFESASPMDAFGGTFGGPAAQGGQEIDAWARSLPPQFKQAGVDVRGNIR